MLRQDRALLSLRITRLDIEMHKPTDGFARCTAIALGGHTTTPNRDQTCRRRICTPVRLTKDPKSLRWLEQHQGDQRRVHISKPVDADLDNADPSVGAAILGKGATSMPLTPSSARPAQAPDAPGASRPQPPSTHRSPSTAPGSNVHNELVAADDFADVVAMIVGHRLVPAIAQRRVTSFVNARKQQTSLSELYGRSGVHNGSAQHTVFP